MTIELEIGGRRLRGWTEATVSRSLETISGTFRATLTESAPGAEARRPIRPGQRCAVLLDGEQVIDGWIDGIAVSYDAGGHAITVEGRDATGDLVDCSAASEPGEWSDEGLLEIASALAGPFGIGVRAGADLGEPFRRFRIEEAETAFEAIERACRFRGVLPLSDGRGGLLLGRPERTGAAAMLRRGRNILAASGASSWADRFSEYEMIGQQAGTDDIWGEDAAHVLARAEDPGVDRHRPLTIVAEQSLGPEEARTRVEWEASVRAARSRSARVRVQGWRETPDGELWAPGRLARIVDDWLGLDREMLVVATAQETSGSGTASVLDLRPEGAFLPRIEPDAEDLTGWWE